MQMFIENFDRMLQKLFPVSAKVIVIGDFNQNILKGETTCLNFMNENGFTQYVKSPTTETGTLIDHVYAKGIDDLTVKVTPTYYSYHEAIEICFKKRK